jgi:phage gp29-like protein
MARSAIMDFLFLGETAVGSFSLAETKTALFAQSLGSHMKRMAETINRDIVDVLWEMNGLDPAIQPKVTHGDLEQRDISQVIGALVQMGAGGAQVFPDRELENALRKRLGMPLAPESGQGADLMDQGAPGEEPPEDEQWQLPQRR